MDGKTVNGEEKNYCSISLPSEEKSIVEYVKNKNHAHQGVNRQALTSVIIKILKIRDHVNKQIKGGRKYKPLSKPFISAKKSVIVLNNAKLCI